MTPEESLELVCAYIAGFCHGAVITSIVAVIAILFLIPPSSAMLTLNETSEILYAQSSNDTHYIETVNNYVNRWFIHIDTDSWQVNSTRITWQNRIGDCSEFSLVKSEMLQYKGIDARVVHGFIPGKSNHDTVEIHHNKYVWFIDHDNNYGFVKTGDGLMPGETISS